MPCLLNTESRVSLQEWKMLMLWVYTRSPPLVLSVMSAYNVERPEHTDGAPSLDIWFHIAKLRSLSVILHLGRLAWEWEGDGNKSLPYVEGDTTR